MVSSVFRLCLAAVLLVTVVSSASVQVSKRAVSSESTSNSSDAKECHPANPCGWAVYIPFTRTVDYFMKNTCVCPKGKSCLRTDDDLSVSAYVYRCRVERTMSSESTSNSSDAKECHPANPCGWAVYIPFTLTVDYFMKNTCVCPKGKSCLRTDDDLSKSAYVYRCRVEVSP